MFNFKETIEKVLKGEISGSFTVKAKRVYLKSIDFKRKGNYYLYSHWIHGNESRHIQLTYCDAGNCLEDIGKEDRFWTITGFIKNV